MSGFVCCASRTYFLVFRSLISGLRSLSYENKTTPGDMPWESCCEVRDLCSFIFVFVFCDYLENFIEVPVLFFREDQ